MRAKLGPALHSAPSSAGLAGDFNSGTTGNVAVTTLIANSSVSLPQAVESNAPTPSAAALLPEQALQLAPVVCLFNCTVGPPPPFSGSTIVTKVTFANITKAQWENTTNKIADTYIKGFGASIGIYSAVTQAYTKGISLAARIGHRRDLPVTMTTTMTGSVDGNVAASVSAAASGLAANGLSLSIDAMAAALGVVVPAAAVRNIQSAPPVLAPPGGGTLAPRSGSDSGLGAGAIAGIVIGSIVGFVILVSVLWWCFNPADSPPPTKASDPPVAIDMDTNPPSAADASVVAATPEGKSEVVGVAPTDEDPKSPLTGGKVLEAPSAVDETSKA